MPLHMIKLCVGAATVEDLLEWQQTQMPSKPDSSPFNWMAGNPIHS